MRLRLTVKLKGSSRSIPINYFHSLSSSLYSLLRFGSEEFSEFLHSKGFLIAGRVYKLFSFAMRFEKMRIQDARIFLDSPNCSIYITSPQIDDFIQNLLVGAFEKHEILIYGDYQSTVFSIENIEVIPPPEFTSSMKFFAYSPLVFSIKKIVNSTEHQYYLRPDDTEEINRVLTNNLLNKFNIVNGRQGDDAFGAGNNPELLRLTWNEEYLRRNARVTKKVTIHNASENPIDVIGIQAPFRLEGNPELIRIGYECGFGEKNSMGFGFAALAK